MGDAPTLDAGYNPPSLRVGGKCRASVHVVQVLVLLAVEDVVVDDLETSGEGTSRPSNERTESSANSQSGTDVAVTPMAR